ncbi:MAG TPA: hypothetical protein VL500_00635 [Candidatus Eisenbacteria bacterium]|jgi:hypothetical protein|nr:hypothetical protein [Candidatus Eisenbacteria bacterium]
MRKDVENLFSKLEPPPAPEGLAGKIMDRIGHEQRRTALVRRIAVFSVGLAASAAAFVPAFLSVRTSLAESGFGQYLSLLFSDGGTVMSAWQDFGFALMESLPAAGIAACLAALLFFTASFMLVTHDMRSLRRN